MSGSKVAGATLTLFCVTAVAWLSVVNLSEYDRARDGQVNARRGEDPIWTFIHDTKAFLTVAFSVGAAAPGAIAAVLESRKRKRTRKVLIIKHLEMIHMRSFAHEGGGMSERHRVSLWVPALRRIGWKAAGIKGLFRKKSVLTCEYRTDRTQPRVEWDVEGGEGLVTKAWKLKTNLEAAPSDGDPTQDTRYLRDTNVSVETCRERTWRNAGMSASPVITGEVEPIAVLLVEGDGMAIALKDLRWDAITIAILLEIPLENSA